MLIDGEGCITANFRRASGNGQPGLQVWVKVVNTSHELTRWAHGLFGGRWAMDTSPSRSPRHKPASYWIITGSRMGDFLRMVQPYVIAKTEHVRVGIAIADAISPRGTYTRWQPMPPEVQAHREALVEELHRLNRRGQEVEAA